MANELKNQLFILFCAIYFRVSVGSTNASNRSGNQLPLCDATTECHWLREIAIKPEWNEIFRIMCREIVITLPNGWGEVPSMFAIWLGLMLSSVHWKYIHDIHSTDKWTKQEFRNLYYCFGCNWPRKLQWSHWQQQRQTDRFWWKKWILDDLWWCQWFEEKLRIILNSGIVPRNGRNGRGSQLVAFIDLHSKTKAVND